jgi:cation:H+ antiporter
VLTAGGELLAEGIRGVVERLGVSQTLLGNTVVAASVEAEEVARVAVPSRRGRGDLALGNIAGTIVHFAALNAGVIALVEPLELDTATRHLHLPVALAATVVLCATLLLRRGISRFLGAVFLALYAAYVAAAIAVA